MRTYSSSLLEKTMAPYLHELMGFHPREWVLNFDNIALTNKNEDLALFELSEDGIYTGHYFFNSRGKEAYEAAQKFLKEVFSRRYDVKVIRGLTPLDKKGALWMNRKLGFKEYGEINTDAGPCRLVFLTRLEWEQLNKEKLNG